MAVNLNGIDLSGAAASSARKASSTQRTTTGSQDVTQLSPSDVSITSTAALLARLQQALGAQPAVDQGRVDAITKAIASGTYRVNPDKITHGLLQSERALGQLKFSEI